MMQPGEAADSIDADFRIDVKDLSSSEARQKLKRATRLPFSVVDRLLESKKDPWQIEEILQLLHTRRLDRKDLDLIGQIFEVPLSEIDWVEEDEDSAVPTRNKTKKAATNDTVAQNEKRSL